MFWFTVNNLEISNRLINVQLQLKVMDKYVNLVYIPGHSGITGNDLADEKARKLACSISCGNTEATENVTVSDVYKLITEIATRSWQRKWHEDSTGRATYSFIPDVGTKVTFPKTREIGVSYCRILLHDTMSNDDAFRTGIADTYMCDCGHERETVEHVLLRCPRHAEARSIMKNNLSDIWNNVNVRRRHKRNLEINESFLLMPFNYNYSDVYRKEDYYVKETLFEFLSTVMRCGGKGYFAECGLRNAESCQRVICGKFDADFFCGMKGKVRNESMRNVTGMNIY